MKNTCRTALFSVAEFCALMSNGNACVLIFSPCDCAKILDIGLPVTAIPKVPKCFVGFTCGSDSDRWWTSATYSSCVGLRTKGCWGAAGGAHVKDHCPPGMQISALLKRFKIYFNLACFKQQRSLIFREESQQCAKCSFKDRHAPSAIGTARSCAAHRVGSSLSEPCRDSEVVAQ